MKKIIYLLLLFAVFQLNVKAQEFHVIPKIGLNISTMTNGGNAKAGLNIGVSGEVLFQENLAFEPGIFFSMQGAKEDNMTLTTNYINIPLLAKGYIYEGFHVFAGPQIGINAKSKAKVKSSGVTVSTDVDDQIKTANLDLVLGFGYLFDTGLNVSFNYNIGLTNALDIPNEKSRHMVAQFNVGWRF